MDLGFGQILILFLIAVFGAFFYLYTKKKF